MYKKSIILFLILMIVACGCRKEVEDTGSSQFYQSDDEVFEIETPYFPLKYPTKWKESVKIDKKEADGVYTVTLNAIVGEHTIPMYAVAFGKISDGNPLGTVKTGTGTYELFIVDYSSATGFELSESERIVYLEMCEDINVIISKLVYDNGMELS